MKVVDTILSYAFGKAAHRNALCRVRVFVGQAGIHAVFTDLGDLNPGMSVTNAIEAVYAAALDSGLIDSRARIIEHYERESSWSLDMVAFTDAGDPRWTPIGLAEAEALLECSDEELVTHTAGDPRLRGLIERARHEFDPFVDAPYLQPQAVIARRMEIEERKISKASVAALVDAGANERSLQKLLKTDLSIFAELYAPDEEYIAFSEFPVADGFVDFAIFTGRSRMDVILIEVKGADFFLANQDSYETFASKIEQGARQIRRRLGEITRNYESFRRSAHKIRAAAEKGSTQHNALLGPWVPLEVDPRKDIDVRYVVIAGRTRDDLAESRLRSDYERSFNPNIQLETWDTWLRKLRRT